MQCVYVMHISINQFIFSSECQDLKWIFTPFIFDISLKCKHTISFDRCRHNDLNCTVATFGACTGRGPPPLFMRNLLFPVSPDRTEQHQERQGPRGYISLLFWAVHCDWAAFHFKSPLISASQSLLTAEVFCERNSMTYSLYKWKPAHLSSGFQVHMWFITKMRLIWIFIFYSSVIVYIVQGFWALDAQHVFALTDPLFRCWGWRCSHLTENTLPLLSLI